MARQRPRKAGPAAAEEQKPDDSQRQEQAARLERRPNDPEWRPLAEYIRKHLGDQFTLHFGELTYLIHGTKNPVPLPYVLTLAVPQLLEAMSLAGPKVARRRLDAVLAGRREKRERPTAERNATWMRWHDEDEIGPTAIARRWNKENDDAVEPNTVKMALRRAKGPG
jgi:hypothetical protein